MAPSDHFDGTRYFNPGQPGTDRSLRELLRWRFLGHHAKWAPAPPIIPARPAPRVPGLAITMVGHASLLIQAAGHNILIDPVWSRRASPLPFAGPRRWDAPGIAFEHLPPIDTVLITHNHYDHLDTATLRRLARSHQPRTIAPLGNEAVLGRAMPGCRLDTGDWGARFPLAPGLDATLHPAYHWSARGPRDRRHALWCGFVLQTPSGPVYAAGDTAYGDGAPFHLVGQRFGPPTVAILPIGAYAPRWFMRAQHVNPDESVRIMQDCGAHQALGMHWGTFQLTDEPRFEPPAALEAACLRQGIDPARFRALRPGDTWSADQTP